MFATPYQVEDPAATAHKLAQGPRRTSEEDILKAIADRSSGFAYIARKVDLAEAEKVSELDLPGIGLLPDSRRIYPQGELAGQVIGTVGIDNQGLTGLEASEDQVLHGTDGEREVDPRRARRRARAQHDRRRADRGRPEADARRQPPGGDRGGPRRDRPDLPARTARPRSSWTRATPRSSRWPTGPASTPRTRPARPAAARQHGDRASPTSRARPSRRSPSPGRSSRAW